MGIQRKKRPAPRRARLGFEPLECRRVLAASVSDFSSLSLDASSFRASSLIVQFRDGTSSAGSLSAYQATLGMDAEWELTPGMRRVQVDDSVGFESVLQAYKNDPNVVFAQPDYRVSINKIPDDASFGSLYGLDNQGDFGGLEDADIDAPEAWDVTTGSRSTIVAVIDTGVDYTHPDLAANIWTNTGEIPGNRIDDDRNGYVDDIHGYDFVNKDGDPMDDHFHGTHVAGTIGAVGDNGIGVVGVNWEVQIMALKFLDAGGGGYTSDAIAALNYAVANGAVVSNNSWGGGGYDAAFENALKNARAKGHIFVAAAGNDGWNNDRDNFYPSGYNVDNIISVAATDNQDQLAWFSNYGRNTVDLAAPGVNILSTFPTRMTPAMQDGGYTTNYASISGTSMATPHVTGVIALVASLHQGDPLWTYDRIIDQVLGTVDLVDGASLTVTGGRLNAAAAVGNAPPDTVGPRIIQTEPAKAIVGTLDHIRVRFSESIDPATFTLADVESLTGPEGPISVQSIVPVAGSNRQFDLIFAPQTVLGPYTLVIGSDIADLAGNLLDQDRDGNKGEPTDDVFTLEIEISNVVGFHSLDVPKDIDNLNSLFGIYTESILTIEQDIIVSDLNVQLNIWFPYDGDLEIVLISPSGTQVRLSSFRGGEGSDFLDTIFDDDASTPIGSGFAPFFGEYRPETSLSAFNGENARGDWVLVVKPDFNIDHFLDGQGFLNAWSLDLAGDGTPGNPGDPPPPPPPPGNRAPVAGADTLEGGVNSRLAVPAAQLLANDTDADGDTLSIAFVGSPVGGSVSLSANQLVIFEPNEDFEGAASFQYIVTDGFLLATGNVTVNIQQRSQWSNPQNIYDVDNNGSVSPADVLDIINVINAYGSAPLPSLFGLAGPRKFLDVNSDEFVAPSDALAVIDYINANPHLPSSTSMGSAAGAQAPPLSEAIHDAALLALITSDAASALFTRKRGTT